MGLNFPNKFLQITYQFDLIDSKLGRGGGTCTDQKFFKTHPSKTIPITSSRMLRNGFSQMRDLISLHLLHHFTISR